MWSFDTFFKEVTNILSKNVVHVFYMNRTASIEVYINDDETFCELKEQIKQHTDVQPDSQILILNSADMEETFGLDTLVKDLPPTTDLKPIFLYHIGYFSVTPTELMSQLPEFPTFSNTVSVENDASLSKLGCSVGHEYKRRIEAYARIEHVMKIGTEQFCEMLHHTISKLIE